MLELAKAREADQHENGLLKAQVDRLQVELKDYRKRLSLNASAGRGSPPSATYNNPSKSGSASTNGQNNFQFDFPKFGALPGSQIFPNAPQNGGVPQNGSVNSSQRGSATPPVTNQSPGSNVAYTASVQQPVLNRANSSGVGTSPGSLQSGGSNTDSPANSSNYSANNIASTYNFAPYSTNDNMHGFATTLPQMNGGGNDPFGDLFSPSILKTVGQSGNGYFNPNQQITRQEVLELYTKKNGWFLRREDDVGSIEEGKLADLTVLSKDYFTVPDLELKTIRSRLTLVGGEVVHSDGSVV